MATRGRKPKATALKVLEGNPGKRVLNKNESRPEKQAIKCPTWLDAEAKKEWRRTAKQLEPCSGCLDVMRQFCKRYPKIKLNVTWEFPYGGVIK